MVAKRQHTRPILVRSAKKGGTAQVLERITFEVRKGSAEKESYTEDWLQNLIFDHPNLWRCYSKYKFKPGPVSSLRSKMNDLQRAQDNFQKALKEIVTTADAEIKN